MATLAPSSKVKVKFVTPNSNSEQLSTALRPWHRRLALQQTLSWTGRGIITGLILACLLLLISRLILIWQGGPRSGEAPPLQWAVGISMGCLVFSSCAANLDRASLCRATRP